MHPKRIAVFGALTAGLGVAAMSVAASAVAAPGNDSSWLADTGPAVPAPVADIASSSPETNLAVTLFGIPIIQEGSAHIGGVGTASGLPLLAIADGSNSSVSTVGLFNIAIADGANSSAAAGGLFDTASAEGADSNAAALGFFDSSTAEGTDSRANTVGEFNSALADGTHSQAAGGAFGCGLCVFNSAIVDGNYSEAGVGGLATGPSIAAVFGNHSGADVGGFFGIAAAFGNDLDAIAPTPIGISIEPLFGTAPSTAADGSWLTDLLDGSWLSGGL